MDGMKYEATKVSKKPSQHAVKKEVAREIDQFGTGKILWHLVKRHKFGLSITLNIVFLINFFLPAWPSIVRSLI